MRHGSGARCLKSRMGLTAPFLSLDDVLTNKLEVGRPQDIADADRLTKMKKIGRSNGDLFTGNGGRPGSGAG